MGCSVHPSARPHSSSDAKPERDLISSSFHLVSAWDPRNQTSSAHFCGTKNLLLLKFRSSMIDWGPSPGLQKWAFASSSRSTSFSGCYDWIAFPFLFFQLPSSLYRFSPVMTQSPSRLLISLIYRVSHIRCSTAPHERGCAACLRREQGKEILRRLAAVKTR
jgi:hypothetical protein